MDKVAKLKSVAKGLALVGAGGILGAGAGISADKQIAKNKRNATAVKGWDTRRRNAKMSKQANDNTTAEVKQVIRAIGQNPASPKRALTDYIKRKLILKARKGPEEKSHEGK